MAALPEAATTLTRGEGSASRPAGGAGACELNVNPRSTTIDVAREPHRDHSVRNDTAVVSVIVASTDAVSACASVRR